MRPSDKTFGDPDLEEWNKVAVRRFDVIKPILAEHLQNLITEFDRIKIWHLSCGSEIRFWQRLTTYQRMSQDCRKSLSTYITTSSIDNFYPQRHLESSGLLFKRKKQYLVTNGFSAPVCDCVLQLVVCVLSIT